MTRFERFSTCAVLAAALQAVPGLAQEPSPSPTTPPPAAVPAYPAATSSASPDNRPVLELSLQDAVARALENNTNIAVERINPEIGKENLKLAKGVYEPLLFSTITDSSRVTPARNVFSGGETVDTDTWIWDFGAAQPLPTGGDLRLDFNNSRDFTDSTVTTFNPSFASSLQLQLQQPLLKNFKIDQNRYQIQVAQRNRDISEVDFRETVLNTTANVKQLYYELIYSADNLAAQRQSLALATKLVEENRIKVRVGTMAPLDVVAAEAEQASREESVIVAENALLQAEDALKQAIFPRHDPAVWNLHVVPTERPTAERVPVDVDAAIQIALERRTDLVAQRLSLENAEYGVRFTRNQKLPQLDLIAAYGGSGIGGTQIIRNPDDPLGPPTGTIPGGFGDALSSVFGRDFPNWTLGVNVSYTILNRQNAAAAARAQLVRDQTAAILRRAELQVASEVRTAGRNVETNYKRVESTRAARVLAERRLDAEEKKFAAGLSTNFLVTQAQRDLAVAQVAELRAIADYRESVVQFDRVQAAGGGVSFLSGAQAQTVLGR
jgi:outer membrane protein TolC